MDRLEPRLHAFCHRADADALDAARGARARARRRAPTGGPLCGVPVGIKDLVASPGMPIRGGSPAYRDFVPEEDDIVVERLRAAGAIILGKTTCTEFGYSGASHNPVGRDDPQPVEPRARRSGGSSAGSGAAVAAGIGPVAIGRDGGGSIRIPASVLRAVRDEGVDGPRPALPVGCRDERYPGVVELGVARARRPDQPHRRRLARSMLSRHRRAPTTATATRSRPATRLAGVARAGRPARPARRLQRRTGATPRSTPRSRRGRRRGRRRVRRDLGCEVEAAHPGCRGSRRRLRPPCRARERPARACASWRTATGTRCRRTSSTCPARPWTAEEFTDAHDRPARPSSTPCGASCAATTCCSPRRSPSPPFPVHMPGPGERRRPPVRDTAWLAFTYPFNITGQPAARSRPASRATACRSGCRSSAATSPTASCCARPRRSRRRALGPAPPAARRGGRA